MEHRPDFLRSGEPARLIPIVSDSAREQKSASVLLAGMRSVYELRQALLKSIGVRVGARATLEAWTEVVFSTTDKVSAPSNDRPDGLLILRTGKKEWKALIEAKIGNETVSEEQISRYLQQAKAHGIDAVITITNQFSALPTHHPVALPKTATKSVNLYHWSWAFVRTQCALLLKNEDVEDEDQVFILREILRYFESDRSGISHFDQMNPEWKDIVNKVKSNAHLTKTSDEVQNTIAAWHQEQRDLCLIMTRLTGSTVSLKLKHEHRLDPAKRLKDDADQFCKTHTLHCALSIPNAAADLDVSADVQRRMIYCSMKLAAPKDKRSTKARVNWLLRQLRKTNPGGFFIRATRPGKAETTYQPLKDLQAAPELIESTTSNSTATTFDVVYEVDLAGKFSGRKVFIEEVEKAVPHFYQEAGQWLKAWTPPAPKIEKQTYESAAAEPQASDQEERQASD
ncbi:hypothetical protein BTO32_10035 [Marinobacter lutaoensis]|uniref:Stress response protein n=1 Tax=Marinobacter lutaoensis TaxID=135739 RepID=A0A1V2DR87_9GAMM|nr:hypothetical protein [Marinobacter lutaoensis]ONF43029.1 hypothetical protein BTO32_10035 [Marinobacter lutaoensis]